MVVDSVVVICEALRLRPTVVGVVVVVDDDVDDVRELCAAFGAFEACVLDGVDEFAADALDFLRRG